MATPIPSVGGRGSEVPIANDGVSVGGHGTVADGPAVVISVSVVVVTVVVVADVVVAIVVVPVVVAAKVALG